MKTYRELWHDHHTSWLTNCKFPNALGRETLVIRASHSLVSHGTERLVTTTKLSKKTCEAMKIPNMKGDFGNQFTYGYSLVGEVIHGTKKMMGRNVHLLHPHQDIAFVGANEAFIVPDTIPLRVATLASNMETAVNAIWDSEINIGDKVLIIGYGLIGALVASIVVQFPGIKLTTLETDDERLGKATEYGITAFSSDEEIEDDFDVAFNCSGNEFGLQVAIDKTIIEGKIVELSWYGSKQVTLDLGSAFHYGRKRIISSQVGTIPAARNHNWSFEKRKKLVFDLLMQTEMMELLDDEIEFSDAPDFYQKLRNDEVNHFSTIITYDTI